MLTDADSVQVHQIGQFLVLLDVPLFPLVDPHAQEVGVHELCPHRSQDVVDAILHQGELTSIEDHAYL